MSNIIIHTGVKGMKWGVAKRDAKEAARAKMFYGESAGTRRKDIKNSASKNARGIVHIINGNKQYAAASALAIMSLVSVGAKTGINKKVASMAKQQYSKIKTNIRAQKIKADFGSWLG